MANRPSTPSTRSRRFIRASEVGEYLFCRRAWWLHQVEGLVPDAAARLARGEEAHAAHGRQVALAHLLRRVALLACAAGLALGLLVWLGWL